MRWGILVLCVCTAGCGDDSSSSDGSAGDGGDSSVSMDGSGGADLTGADLTCTVRQFPGFPGVSSVERSFDCSCGCILDSFANAASVSGFWNGTMQSASYFVPTASGLEMVVDTSQGAPAIAGLSSTNVSNQWFLSGDFDLTVEYEIVGAMVSDGHAILQVNDLKGALTSVYTVERDRTHAAADQYTGTVAGITPVSVATSSTSGTLELKRTGVVLQAIAEGIMVTQYTGAVTDRMAVLLTTGLEGPCPLDGGAAVDGSVPGCRLSVRWKNLRLSSGVVVDRQ